MYIKVDTEVVGNSVESIWNHRNLLGIEELSVADLDVVFSVAKSFKETFGRRVKKLPPLRGKTVANLFMEPSTRTRVAFEMAAKRLSADTIGVSGDSSSLTKGESLTDTARNIQALDVDLIVLRHSSAGAAHFLSQRVDIPVINAGDGAHEHPTQGLLDTFTMSEKKGSLRGKKVTILGDILFSRVARSNIWALQKLGASVTVAGPSTLVPKRLESLGITVKHDLRKALDGAEVVMLLRIQHERQNTALFPSIGEYCAMFGLNKTRAEWIDPNALIMHPGPINRGVEIDSDLADSHRSVILDQVTNGIAVRMAVLYLCSRYHDQQRIKSVSQKA